MNRLKAYAGRVVFDHQPKTGGSAVSAWLHEQLGGGCVSPHVDGEHATLLRQWGGLYSIVCGHVSFVKGEGLDPRYQYVTLLREPLERILSWLCFVANNHTEGELRGLVPLARRFLASDGRELDAALLPHISNHYVAHFCRIHGDGHEDEATRLSNALAALQDFDIVGRYDAMPAFLADLAALIGVPAPRAIARVNVTRERPAVEQVPDALRARLIELNRLDLDLYARAMAHGARAPAPCQRFERAAARSMSTPDVRVLLASAPQRDVQYGERVSFDLDIALERSVPALLAGIHITGSDGRLAFGINSAMLGQHFQQIPAGSHRLTHVVHALLPAGKYGVGFAFVELRPEGGRELAWYDNMCSIDVHHAPAKQALGYAELNAAMHWLMPQAAATPRGALRALAPPGILRRGQLAHIEMELCTPAAQDLTVAHHWLHAGTYELVCEGLPVPLPAPGAGAPLNFTLELHVPAAKGDYLLVATLASGGILFYEAHGFAPARVPVRVLDPAYGVRPAAISQSQGGKVAVTPITV
ncbi:MAG: Wzt carbohydrate-binding domain-containing protein [Pseudomonadota bacterium]